MHGFSQGFPFINDFCNSNNQPDILFIQEHWLTPANMYKLNLFHTNYINYGISAMEEAVEHSILKGRPFGGVSILMKQCLTKYTKFVECRNKFVLLVIGTTVLINVYLPSVNTRIESEVLYDLLNEINEVLETAFITIGTRIVDLIVGGDFNTNLDSKSIANRYVEQFMSQYMLIDCNSVIRRNIPYTYYHDSLQQFSVIDYFLISNCLSSRLIEFRIEDNLINLSDHMPLIMVIGIELVDEVQCISHTSSDDNLGVTKNAPTCIKQLDWVSSRKTDYYELTRNSFIPIFDNILELHQRVFSKDNNVELFNTEIESIYKHIVSALSVSAHKSISIKKVNFTKFWWDAEMNILKARSVEAHKTWVNAGRPRQGNIFIEKQKHKRIYKVTINSKKKLSDSVFSTKLYDQLIDQNQHSFWKLWNSKFKKSKSTGCTPISIDGLTDEKLIANKFAENFGKICKPKDKPIADHLKDIQDFYKNIDNCKSFSDSSLIHIDTDKMQNIITDTLHEGKAAGFDGLSSEHLIYSHPIVTASLSKLFSVMIKCNYVPDDFGVGITVPIPKEINKGANSRLDQFRGITILPIISKMFECVLLEFLKPYLKTEESQFGFKKGNSCAHAIYTVRKTVEAFCLNGSTVNLCSLDISKAFDKINHVKLLLKLIDRNVPRECILLLKCWYSKIQCCVRWGNTLSHFVKLTAGVRQGGILSPYLFAIYVNDVLINLKYSKLGCHLKGFCFNSVMYADDLIILSISLTDLRKMINICKEALDIVELDLNVNKSGCMRIGPRFDKTNIDVILNGTKVPWKNEINYLGVCILSGRSFKCNIQKVKCKFFRAVNGVLGKISNFSAPMVVLSLIATFCVPVLTYGLNALYLNKSSKHSLDRAFDSVFYKLFKVKDQANLALCQIYCGYTPMSCQTDLLYLNFLEGVCKSQTTLPKLLFDWFGRQEYHDTMCKYDIRDGSGRWAKRIAIERWFSNSVYGVS